MRFITCNLKNNHDRIFWSHHFFIISQPLYFTLVNSKILRPREFKCMYKIKWKESWIHSFFPEENGKGGPTLKPVLSPPPGAAPSSVGLKCLWQRPREGTRSSSLHLNVIAAIIKSYYFRSVDINLWTMEAIEFTESLYTLSLIHI